MLNNALFYTGKVELLLLILLFILIQSMKQPRQLFLLTGSNIEPRLAHLKKAEKYIAQHIGNINRKSEVYESEPWGFEDEVMFLNQVLVVETELNAQAVLEKILSIENELGRERDSSLYSSRTIDIDILYLDDEVVANDDLIIPHARLHQRRFTLMPLSEVAPLHVHPVLGVSNNELLQKVDDSSKVWIYDTEQK